MNLGGGGIEIIRNNNFKKFTVEEKTILYLYKLNFLKNKQIIPEIFTEQGLQKSMACSLGFISQVLTKLENKKYVTRELVKIENKKRKQSAFFLTEEGIEYARELKKVASEVSFEIIKDNYTQKNLLKTQPFSKYV